MKTVGLKLLFVCAVMLLFNVTPVAFGLIVGFNPDIHMDVQGVIANDFHVQGRLESGNFGGNWSNPPVLISHIDGGFPNFNCSITPDLSDPCGQNWYNFTADWSGTNYQYCSIIHLGLFFDVTCNNVAVNLVGWWTKDGKPIPPNIVPPPLNGGAVLIPGFNVQDIPHPEMPQRISLFNHSREGGGGGGGGIYAQVVQMDVVSLTKEELETYLGPIPRAFEELRVGGKQEGLTWVPVENENGPISETNPQPFPVDSFFDVFFDIGFPIHTARPIQIPPGGFLVARERVRFVNNAGQPEIRWDWMIHGAHESDLGDAPDSTNSFGMMPPPVLMTAYPKGGPAGVIAHYPSVYQIGSPPFGPIHWAAPLIAFLGPWVSSEMEADIGPDADPTNNIIPLKDMPDLDNFDDSVQVPLVLPNCQLTTFNYVVTIMPPMPPPMPQTPPLYVNVWFDWNRDGDWDDTMQCPGATAPIPAPEWAVQNQLLVGLPVGLNMITTPRFMPWHPATGVMQPIWMRITLSEQRWAPTAGVLGNGGCGPANGYIYGETEDYYFTPEVPPPPDMDFGDAPEAWTAGYQYPTTLANNGARHVIVQGVFLGAQIDAEADGQPTLLADGDDTNNLADEDGVIAVTPLVPGGMVNVTIVASVAGTLSGWIDYNRDGDWDEAEDLVFAGTPLAAGANPLQFTVPTTAVPGVTYARLRFTTADIALRYDGLADDGEVEDYIVKIEEIPIKPPAEHLKWSQPPIELDPKSRTPVYCGWDQPSFHTIPVAGGAGLWQVVADDFRCIGSMPITSVHWWGSYKGWQYPQPPQLKPVAWRIGFWSNIIPMPPGSVSQPGKLLWQIEVPATRVHEEWSGIDEFPDSPMDTCFQYYVDLTQKEYFWQQKFIDTQTKDDVFWISIVAVYGGFMPPPNIPWGWKTRPAHWMDDAITFRMEGELEVGYVLSLNLVNPIEGYICGQVESYDMAFELDTDPNYIKWEQPFTGIRDWPHYEDQNSIAIEYKLIDKWLQPPDLTPFGVDVDMFWVPLADDFKCTQTGPIKCIRIWGSFADDILPPNGVGSLTLQLTIYSDTPSNPPNQPFSKPGKVVWGPRVFNPGEYTVNQVHQGPEDWYDPATGFYHPANHQLAFQYDFHIADDAFIQQEGTIYWLEVKDLPFPPPDPDPRKYTFGWKTTTIENRWNDDAVFNYWLPQPPRPPLVPGWNPLLYPPGHRYANTTLDLAFEIQTEKAELDIRRMVADDWRCTSKQPITAIVWWGSYIGYRYEACKCREIVPVPPTKPDYFLLSIWTDVPANSTGDPYKFSHPGTKVWEYRATQYDEVLVGFDKHPLDMPPSQVGGNEPVYRYSVKLPKANWFLQKELKSVFWLSVVAVYRGPQPMIYPWGWTNHSHVYNDDAVAGYIDYTGPAPVWRWEELYDQTGMSEDMSFVLFTEPECLIGGIADASEYADWVAWGKPNCWCYQYQCRGDINGKKNFGVRVQLLDLQALAAAFNKNDAALAAIPNGICADVNHKKNFGVRVQLLDLQELAKYFNKPDAQVPSCDAAPLTTGPYNYWREP